MSKTVTVELHKWEVSALVRDAQANLGRRIVEYGDQENFGFMIDKALVRLAELQELLDSFD